MADAPISFSDLFDGSLAGGRQTLDEFAAAVGGLNKAYKAFVKATESDGARTAAAIRATVEAAQALGPTVQSINISRAKERAGIDALEDSIDALLGRQQALLKQDKDRVATQQQLAQTTGLFNKELKAQREVLKQAYAAGNFEGLVTAAKQVQALTQDAQALNKVLRGATSEFTSAAGSYDRASQELTRLRAELRALENGLAGTTPRARELATQIQTLDEKLRAADLTMGQGFRSIGEYSQGILKAVAALEKEKLALTEVATALRTQAQATGLSAETQQALQTELAQTEAALHKNEAALKGYGVGVARAGKGSADLSGHAQNLTQSLLGSYYGVQGLATAVQQVFTGLVEYSDELSSVRRTTSLSADEAERLTEALKAIPTRTNLSGLLGIATVGGQLGKTKDEILGFTQSIDVAVQALQDDFGGSAESIATTLGKLELVFRQSLGPDQAQNLLNVGSALNSLGQESSATAGFLADFSLRVGATAANAKLSLANVLSYGSTLEQVGYSAEIAATSVSRLINTLSTRTEAAYNIAKLADANLTLVEFKHLVNHQFQEAIQLFLRGLSTGGRTTTEFNGLLKTLKLSSGEAKSVITTLARNTELFSAAQKTANSQLREGTSLADEAKLRNENLAGSYDKLKNTLSNLFTDGFLGEQVKSVLDEQRGRLEGIATVLNKIKQAALAANDALAKTRVGKAVGLTAREPENVTTAFGKNTKATLAQADALQKQLDRYQELSRQVGLNAAEQREAAQIVRGLQRDIAANVASVQQQTGALVLNTDAVQDAITARRQFAAANGRILEQFVFDATEAVEATQRLSSFLNEKVGKLQIGLDAQGLKEDLKDGVENLLAFRKGLGPDAQLGGTSGYTLAERAQISQYADAKKVLLDAEKDLAANEALLKKQQADLANAQAALTSLRKAATVVTTKQSEAEDTSTEALKAKKQATADVAAEEFKLAKARLEARAADLERQAENPANAEALRTEALRKATAVRISIAALEQVEGKRLAEQGNQDKINGERATQVTKLLLSEQYAADVAKLNQKLSKDELALHYATLDALAQADRLHIEQQILGQEKIRDNTDKTYAERQAAAQQIADFQISLARLTRDEQIRAAKGALDKIQQAEAQFVAAVAKAQEGVKPFDSAKYTDELSKGYAVDALALENLHAKKLVSEKNYLRQVRDLENQQEQAAIAALEREFGETEAVLRRKAALRKKMAGEELEDTQKTEQKRNEIITQALATISQIQQSFADIKANKLSAEREAMEARYSSETKIAGEQDEQKYQKAKAALDYQKAYELQAAGKSETLKAQIEETYRQKGVALENDRNNLRAQAELNYRRKKAELDHKEFVAGQKRALANVFITTAQAVVASVLAAPATFGLPFSAFALVTGAAAAATILSQKPPLPQYFKGREGGPAEWAMVAEKGPELITGRSGGVRLVERPSVTYLQHGDTVHTAPRTEQILANPETAQLMRSERYRYKMPAYNLLRPDQGTLGLQHTMRETAAMHAISQQLMQHSNQAAAQAAGNGNLGQVADRIIDGVVHGVVQGVRQALHERPEVRLDENGMHLYTKQQDSVTKHVNRYYKRNG